ncbi:hypothetical protein BP5796_05535 [Coleophoma crateriformis]|uniref:Aminotransferase class I/classII domain-containing protein n=1 Tax=Coleophoma crateriformis TaxID=565419 RepID=A0A3D8S3E8_9HELO|nr:hypothetical protein BP5796_05535 [Coleophoma crateriformis]
MASASRIYRLASPDRVALVNYVFLGSQDEMRRVGYRALRVTESAVCRTLSSTSNMSNQPQKSINLLRGWPNTSLLPASQLACAAQTALTTPSIYTPGLQYGPDPGYQPLREEISKWLSDSYSPSLSSSPPSSLTTAENICITGGASQNLACILQVFSDPIYTKNVWIVAPCYFLACRIFGDSGFAGKLRAVPEDEGGIDLQFLEKCLDEVVVDENEAVGAFNSSIWLV